MLFRGSGCIKHIDNLSNDGCLLNFDKLTICGWYHKHDNYTDGSQNTQDNLSPMGVFTIIDTFYSVGCIKSRAKILSILCGLVVDDNFNEHG